MKDGGLMRMKATSGRPVLRRGKSMPPRPTLQRGKKVTGKGKAMSGCSGCKGQK